MLELLTTLLAAHGITALAPIALRECTVTRGYLLEREGIADGTAILFAVPYYTTHCDNLTRNISSYAVSGDYHVFFRALFEDILPALREAYPKHRFAGFTDHSPIAEADAAARAGLGFFGRNHLFLTKEHSSYVFLGEIITDAMLPTPPVEKKHCDGCGACARACPVGLDISRCRSALTQQKGSLTQEEIATLRAHGCAWGCDICQEVCPVTRRAKEAGTLYSSIPYFNDTAIPHITRERIEQMSDDDFSARAYSWRGRTVILRNLALLEEDNP